MKKLFTFSVLFVLIMGTLSAQELTKVRGTNQSEAIPSVVISGAVLDEATFIEDVESHASFTINSTTNGWSYIDEDGSVTYGFSGITFEHSGNPMSFIVFEPSATTPVLNEECHSGDKMFASFAAVNPPNNDWIISPMLTNPTKITFWARSYVDAYGLETFKVAYSTTGTEIYNFTFITTAAVTTPVDWTEYSYDIPQDAKFVAIQCVSNDAFIFFLDDITIYTSGANVTTNALENITVSPNPATTTVAINGNAVKAEIYNVAGQLVKSVSTSLNNIDVTNLEAGVYFFKVFNTNNESKTEKVIIK